MPYTVHVPHACHGTCRACSDQATAPPDAVPAPAAATRDERNRSPILRRLESKKTSGVRFSSSVSSGSGSSCGVCTATAFGSSHRSSGGAGCSSIGAEPASTTAPATAAGATAADAASDDAAAVAAATGAATGAASASTSTATAAQAPQLGGDAATAAAVPVPVAAADQWTVPLAVPLAVPVAVPLLTSVRSQLRLPITARRPAALQHALEAWLGYL